MQTDALNYFASMEYGLPLHVNPADFLIDISAIDSKTPEAEEASKAKVNQLALAWQNTSKNIFQRTSFPPFNSLADEKNIYAGKAPIWRQTMVLTQRLLTTTIRDPFGLTGSLIEAIIMGLITGLVFLNIDKSLQGIRSRTGALYVAAALQGYLILLYETWRLSNIDIHVFDREHGEGVVSVTAFLVSRRVARLFLEDVPVPLIFSVCAPKMKTWPWPNNLRLYSTSWLVLTMMRQSSSLFFRSSSLDSSPL